MTEHSNGLSPHPEAQYRDGKKTALEEGLGTGAPSHGLLPISHSTRDKSFLLPGRTWPKTMFTHKPPKLSKEE